MKNIIRYMLPVMLLVTGSTPAAYAQDHNITLPKYFEISDGTEWTSELLTFDEPINGFRLTVFETNYTPNKYNGYPFVTLAEVDINDADGNEITYTTTTNSLAANDGGGLAALCDNNTATHYHSAYSGNAAIAPNDYVYIEFTFDEPQSAFTYRQVRRNNNRNFPLYFAFSALGEEVNPPFNPENPSEPNLNFYHNIIVKADPTGAAYVSGGGKLLEGNTTTLNTSLKNSRYKFSHWTKDGELYSQTNSCTYTVTGDATFVAHYNFVPESPEEPSTMSMNRLYLTTNCEDQCSFNRTSGLKVEADTWVTLRATISAGYVFLGWYNGSTFITNSTSFNYQMPNEEVTLTAKVLYNPTSPGEPESDGTQSNIQTTPTGDVNKDGAVDVADLVAVINVFLKVTDTDDQSRYDVNGDGAVDVSDVVKIINVFLGK